MSSSYMAGFSKLKNSHGIQKGKADYFSQSYFSQCLMLNPVALYDALLPDLRPTLEHTAEQAGQNCNKR